MPTQDVTFVHLTDLHISAPALEDETLFGDSEGALRRSLAEIARMDPRPEFVVISGDLANRGEVESYRHLRAILDEAAPEVPVILALGNHDDRAGFAAAFPERASGAGPYDHDLVVSGLHVIVLDSSIPTGVEGGWEPGQMDWLAARLDAHAGLPKLLVIHHPPMLDEAKGAAFPWKSLTLPATRALRETIAGRDVVGILSGHIHLDRAESWHGVPVIIGAGHHAASDPVAMGETLRMLDATGFAICTLRPSGLGVTFVPHPQTRALAHEMSLDALRAYIAEKYGEPA
ncbi:metallophosphoesterase [Albimonas sp. CAU 1670]|uniref:metallophosphoesterase n=1 Tax=Albimonas sp. CAU 1670 TaxID=3032599 RepID=UPI0023DCB4C8|nr:metallophosphoesterase [Albimonas sp. CAU 1670]MDF2235089.1 metallophosphoesterase [Albimonas sp. CAU 1670]